MQYFGMPEPVPGVNKHATFYKISSGWLVSYRPKPHGEDEDWKGSEELDEAISKVVAHDEPVGLGLASNYIPMSSEEARAFATLDEALKFLKGVLG